MQDPFNITCEETVHDRIKQLLVSYAFFPGDRLHVPALADRLRVSATPVREALSRLCAEGLLTAVPHRGFFVKRLDQSEIADLLDMKYLLLSRAVAASPEHPPFGKAERAMLSKLAALGDGGGDSEAAVADYERHAPLMVRLVGSLSANAVLLAYLESVMDRLHFVRQTEVRLPELSQAVLGENGGLARALLDHRLGDLRAQLQQQHRREQACLPMLMKECISRLYLRAQPQATPAARSTPLTELPA